MTIGDRIRAIRIQKGMTQKAVAQKCNMADSAIRKYESGAITPKFETMDRIAIALGVPVTALMGYSCVGQDADGNDIYAPPDDIIEVKSVDTSPQSRLIDSFEKLNPEGQEVAIQRIIELSEIPKYRKI